MARTCCYHAGNCLFARADAHIARARELLESGTDLNVRSEKVNAGTPAVAWAIELSTDGDDQFAASRELLGLLLQHGANPNIRWCGPDGDVVAALVADSGGPTHSRCHHASLDSHHRVLKRMA